MYSEDRYGDETVEARFQATGGDTPVRYVHALARGLISQGGPCLRAEPARGHGVGAHARRGSAGVAAPPAGQAGSLQPKDRLSKLLLTRGGGQRLPHPVVDGAATPSAFSYVWTLLRGVGFSSQRPWPCHPARRAGDPGLETKRWPPLKKRPTRRPQHRLRRRIGSERSSSREDLCTERPPGASSTASSGSSSP